MGFVVAIAATPGPPQQISDYDPKKRETTKNRGRWTFVINVELMTPRHAAREGR